MKIAIACESNIVCEHFGHCEGFYIYEVEDNTIKNKEFVKNPGHRPGFLPKYLADLNVNVIIAGGMGGAAQALFNENSIKVVVGASGENDEVINNYLNNSLTTTDNACNEK